MANATLTDPNVSCFSYSLQGINVPAGGTPPGFQPGYSPPPPPPPAPAQVVTALLIDTGSSFLLAVGFDRPVSGSDPFLQAHPWIYEADGSPASIGAINNGPGTNVWLWESPDPTGPNPQFIVPVDTELDVEPGTYPIS